MGRLGRQDRRTIRDIKKVKVELGDVIVAKVRLPGDETDAVFVRNVHEVLNNTFPLNVVLVTEEGNVDLEVVHTSEADITKIIQAVLDRVPQIDYAHTAQEVARYMTKQAARG